MCVPKLMRLILSENNSISWLNNSPPCCTPRGGGLPTFAYVRVVPFGFHERKLGHLEGQASNLGNLGLIAQDRGNLDEAEKLLRESLEINRKLGRLEGQASQLGNLGLIAKARGNLDEAEKLLRESLEIFRKLGRLEGQANQLGNLGSIAKQHGDMTEARRLWTQSRDLYARIGMPHMVKKVQGWLDGLPPE